MWASVRTFRGVVSRMSATCFVVRSRGIGGGNSLCSGGIRSVADDSFVDMSKSSRRKKGRQEGPEKSPTPLHLRVALFDAPWQSTLERPNPIYPLALHAYRFQDTWSGDEHEAFWLALLHAWPRRRGGTSSHETLGYIRRQWKTAGVTNEAAAESMHLSKGSIQRINYAAGTHADRQTKTREAMAAPHAELLDALQRRNYDAELNDTEESVRWRLPRVGVLTDPGFDSCRGESISYRALTPDERLAVDRNWERAVAAQYKLASVPPS